MSVKISKELFFEVKEFKEFDFGYIYNLENEKLEKGKESFYFRCIDWAYSNNYVLDCFSKCVEIRKQNEEDILHIERGELLDNSCHDISLVLKACQWILDNKK